MGKELVKSNTLIGGMDLSVWLGDYSLSLAKNRLHSYSKMNIIVAFKKQLQKQSSHHGNIWTTVEQTGNNPFVTYVTVHHQRLEFTLWLSVNSRVADIYNWCNCD